MLRLLLALFLLIPTPAFAEDVPNEVTVNEDFSDDTYQEGLTISGGSTDAYIYCQEQGRYGTTGCSLALQSGTYVFEFAEDVYEIGFLVGAVNNTYDVKYYYSDDTDETIQKAAQSWGEDGNDMYDDFYKSFTDYNNNEANTDKFITKFEVTLTDISVLDTLYWQYVEIPVTTTTSSTTTSTTTTTTTVPPKPEPEPEPYIPPPPPPPTPEEIIVDVKVEGVDKTYTQADVNDGTIERDQERVDNEAEYGCFMTNAQIERGDCDIPEPIEEDIKDDIIEEDVVIKEDIVEDKEDVEVIIPEDDVVVLDPPKEEVIEDEVVEFEEPPIEFEIIEFDLEDIAPEDVVEIPVLVEVVEDEPIKEDIPEVLEEDTPDTTLPPVEIKPEREDIVLTEEEVAVEVAEVVEIVEDIVIEEATVEEVVEVLEQVNDIGVQNLSSVTEETQTVIQEVVEEAIADVAELTEEQVEVVAEVLQVEAEDVAIIAESVKDDEVIAEAVEEYVERAVENADVENYTLADVVTEVQFETFIDNPIQTFIDIDIQEINFSDIGNDMTNDQKEKAQEVVVPVILTRIATMAAFIFRRGNV
ncbi:hypothetical protein [uncultured Mediterranean phage uvMED]|nr:hypothetical protein [uncultured Mediterranean phage uvMED]